MVKNILSIAAIFGLLLCCFVSCSDQNDKAPSYPFTAEVVSLVGTASDHGAAQFKLGPQTFTTLRDLDALTGDYLNVTFGGELTAKEQSGSLVVAEKFSGGEKPKLRYYVKNGVVVPRDYVTLILLSAYYQFDQIFLKLEQKTGLKMADMVAKAALGKFQMMFEPQFTLESTDANATQTNKLNAAYMPGQKQFILFRRSAIEKLPLATNFQVLTHEFGHAIFEKTFYKDVADEKDRYQIEWAMRGLNEGFADFISFVFTDSGDVIRGSLDILDLPKERDFVRSTFTYSEYAVVTDSTINPACSQGFYCIGTIFARSLYNARSTLVAAGTTTNDEFPLLVVTALQTTLDEMKKTALPAALPDNKLGKEKSLTNDASVISAFLNAFVSQMPANTRATLCAEFSKDSQFGIAGYPTTLRTGCGT